MAPSAAAGGGAWERPAAACAAAFEGPEEAGAAWFVVGVGAWTGERDWERSFAMRESEASRVPTGQGSFSAKVTEVR